MSISLKLGVDFKGDNPTDFNTLVKINGEKIEVSLRISGGTSGTTDEVRDVQAIKDNGTHIDPATENIRGKEVTTDLDVDVKANKIEKVEITFNKEFRSKALKRLLFLRRAAAGENSKKFLGTQGIVATADDAANAGQNTVTFTLKGLKSGVNSPRLRFSEPNAAGCRILFLEEQNDFDKMEFDVNFYDNFDGTQTNMNDKIRWNFQPLLDEHGKIEQLFFSLSERYGCCQAINGPAPITAGLVGEVYIENLPDLEWKWWDNKNALLADASTNELDDFIQQVEKFSTATAGGTDDEKRRHFFLEAKYPQGGNDYIYKHEVEGWLKMLKSIKKWREVGLSSTHEILITRSINRFEETDIDTTSTPPPAGKIRARKYKGFDIVGGKVEIEEEPGHQVFSKNIFKINKGKVHKKEEIDIFKERLRKSGLTSTNKIPDLMATNAVDQNGAGLAEWETATDPRDCLGFYLGSLNTVGGAGSTGHGTEGLNAVLTKVCFDLLDAPTRQAAIELAFYGKDYDENVRDGKKPNKNLELNEVSAKNFFSIEADAGHGGKLIKAERKTSVNRVEVLKLYYEVMKLHLICSWKGKDGLAAAEPGYNDPNAKAEIDNAYNTALKWAQIWDRWGGSGSPDKVRAQKDKEVLDGFLGMDGRNASADEVKLTASNPDWKTKMATIRNEAIAVINGERDKDRAKEADIEKSKTDSGVISDKAKTIFETAKAEVPLPFKTVLVELEKLAKLLEEIHKDTKTYDTAYSDLNGYKTGTDDKKTAWAIADKVDDDGKGYATTALEKLEKEFKTAKESAKNELGDKAATAIDIEGKTKVQEINEIKELFKKSKQAWGLNSKTDTLYDALYNALDAAQNNAAWTSINNYRKNKDDEDCTEGYAAGAFRKLKEFKEQADKGVEEIKKAASVEDMRTTWETLPLEKKNQIAEETLHRLQAWKKLVGNGDEKALGQALGEKVDTTEFKDNDEDYKKINSFIKNLKKFEGKKSGTGNVEEEILQKLKSIPNFCEPEKLISAWLSRLEERQKVLHESYLKRNPEEKNRSPETPFWKSPVVIFLFWAGVVAVIGGLIWWVFKRRKEESVYE